MISVCGLPRSKLDHCLPHSLIYEKHDVDWESRRFHKMDHEWGTGRPLAGGETWLIEDLCHQDVSPSNTKCNRSQIGYCRCALTSGTYTLVSRFHVNLLRDGHRDSGCQSLCQG